MKGLAVMIALNQKIISQSRRIKYLSLLFRCGYCLKVKYNDKYYKQV